MWSAPIASNVNFPAPLAVLGFVAASGGLFVALPAAVIFWFVRKPGFARAAVVLVAGGAAFYFALLLAFSAGGHKTVLARGQENISVRSTAILPIPWSTSQLKRTEPLS